MIVASETRYVPVAPGYLTLQDTEELYYYVHKTFYEQAVIIKDRYGEDVDALQKQIGGNPDYVAVQKFVDYAPRPINIMGYFLALLKEDIEDYEDIIGAMDVIATSVNLRRFLKQPVSIRQSVVFGLSIRNEYRDSWDLFIQNCYEYEWMKATLAGSAPPMPQVSSYRTEATSGMGEVGVDDMVNPDGSMDMDAYNAYMAAELEKIEAEVAEKRTQGGASASAPVSTPAPAPEPETSSTLGGDGLSVIAKTKAKRRAL